MTKLSPEHQAMLTASGISEAIRDARGYETVTEPDELAGVGFEAWVTKHVPGLLVPMWSVFGEIVSHQYRPDTPIRKKGGKTVRYLSLPGEPNVLDCHPAMRHHLLGTTPILITEGVKKADALTSIGCATLALTGVWNWRGSSGDAGPAALADFDAISWKGREIFLVPDSDVRDPEKPDVARAFHRLQRYLEARQR